MTMMSESGLGSQDDDGETRQNKEPTKESGLLHPIGKHIDLITAADVTRYSRHIPQDDSSQAFGQETQYYVRAAELEAWRQLFVSRASVA